ncbi:sequence-specific DNA binding transcription factor [Rhynchospora pubera]|uniref:Sequence-specific DNA binding transcription factor n=1 Tax=Rhynchospora pubera TaxID=906938 RepID=A0AAV8CJW4_9POAL|nr:sequence-specific DNA binding transcription factor [Rhynchospora pubera]
MQNTIPSKQVLLKTFLTGLRRRNITNKGMTLLERKRAIKLSADLAMASVRKEAKWSNALMADLSRKFQRKTVLPSKHRHVVIKGNKVSTHKRGARRRCAAKATAIAKCIIRKREQVLRRLVPGGKCMDECTLLDETLDYLQLLKAQVDVMRLLVKALE